MCIVLEDFLMYPLYDTSLRTATRMAETCTGRRLTLFTMKCKILLNVYMHLLVSSSHRISLMHENGLFKISVFRITVIVWITVWKEFSSLRRVMWCCVSTDSVYIRQLVLSNLSLLSRKKYFWLSFELSAIKYVTFTNPCCGNMLNYMGFLGNITCKSHWTIYPVLLDDRDSLKRHFETVSTKNPVKNRTTH
jgi:hypothetical protein